MSSHSGSADQEPTAPDAPVVDDLTVPYHPPVDVWQFYKPAGCLVIAEVAYVRRPENPTGPDLVPFADHVLGPQLEVGKGHELRLPFFAHVLGFNQLIQDVTVLLRQALF